MKVDIKILYRDGVKDSQGESVLSALKTMGHNNVQNVLVGKYIVLTMDEDTEEARAAVKKMCDDFLANLVIEKYNIEYPEPLEKEND